MYPLILWQVEGTVDAVLIMRRLIEKYQSKGKKLFYLFVDLEKLIDRAPHKVAWHTFLKRRVPEYLV